MSIEKFIEDNLDVVKELVANQKEVFDSHQFIRCFMKKFELDYVKFLGNYEDEPFKNVNKQIANTLSKYVEELGLSKNGKVTSPNVFGNETQNEQWSKS